MARKLTFGDIRDKTFAIFVSDEHKNAVGEASPLLMKDGRSGQPCLLRFNANSVEAGRPVEGITEHTPITLIDLSAYLEA